MSCSYNRRLTCFALPHAAGRVWASSFAAGGLWRIAESREFRPLCVVVSRARNSISADLRRAMEVLPPRERARCSQLRTTVSRCSCVSCVYSRWRQQAHDVYTGAAMRRSSTTRPAAVFSSALVQRPKEGLVSKRYTAPRSNYILRNLSHAHVWRCAFVGLVHSRSRANGIGGIQKLVTDVCGSLARDTLRARNVSTPPFHSK